MTPLVATGMALVTPLGRGVEPTWTNLRAGNHGLRPMDFEDVRISTWIGRVDGLEDEALTGPWADFDCRNNRLAMLALREPGFANAVERIRRRYGAGRVAVFVGTTTSGILETEQAYRHRDPTGALPPLRYARTQNLYSVTELTRQVLRLGGPAFSISTACSSSAKVFAAAARVIAAGCCDAAVVGGVDSLCFMTLYGFAALGLLSTDPCRPCDAERSGLTISEAAGYVVLERAGPAEGDVALLGYGESSDAYHMSSPHPEGRGAVAAMQGALGTAGLTASDVDYVNLHGTGTHANDRAEDVAVQRVFGGSTACSSTKGATGHALGAAGITEAVLSMQCLRDGFVPGTRQTRCVDQSFGSLVVLDDREIPLRAVMSNSFGFGGNNCSLIFGRHR
ncbi:beta-ketoacyl-[acyl-carrier-protein] synthase II [Nitrospira sp.]|nr:beta-ketoacyl-[acyl-carrier-protein] synthase II [Nitrospira sp.]